MNVGKSFWSEQRVLVTGNTGFKGSWLTMMLKHLGAQVAGYALTPVQKPKGFSNVDTQKLADRFWQADINDLLRLEAALQDFSPTIVYHLAAQPIVSEGYENPLETFETNVLGTAKVLQACRSAPSLKTIVNITTDKVYEDRTDVSPYGEAALLGGRDPYAASKVCAEHVARSYYSSFFSDSNVCLATVRAGNVIGGGDWAKNRLLPDIFRALALDEPLKVRSPQAIRPWQHVLEPLRGYILLAENLFSLPTAEYSVWNFGPEDSDMKQVQWILDYFEENLGLCYETINSHSFRETEILRLDSSKAKGKLGWAPRFGLELALRKTGEWYIASMKNEDVKKVMEKQITEYISGY